VSDSISTKIDFLKQLGSDKVKHGNQSLLEHLIGVRDILKKGGAPEYVQDGGLFHSVYGTTYFKPQMTTDRDAVCCLIGEKAEELAYWFCFLDSPRTQRISILENKQLKKDLLLIDKANVEDQANASMDRLDFYKDV
jgi:hypothetical protein